MSTEQVDAITDPLKREMVRLAARDLRTYLEANGVEPTFNVEGAAWFMVHAVAGPARTAVWNELTALHADTTEADDRYDRDPAALAWVRSKIGREIARLREWQQRAAGEGNQPQSDQWRRCANYIQRTFLGDGGCVVAAFDDRLPMIRQQFDKEATR